MKIIRNGQEFELTSLELTQAYVDFSNDPLFLPRFAGKED